MKTSAQPSLTLRSGLGRLLAPASWCLAFVALAAGLRANQAMTLAAGRSVTLSVTADGTQPFTYQWRKDGLDLAGATEGTYVISSFGSFHAGVYTVRVANAAGTTLSDAATLNLEAVVAPLITAQPLSRTALSGDSISFTAAASGSDPLTYRWHRDGVALSDGVNVSGATTTTLSLSGVSPADAGAYTIVVTNGAGTATSAGATLAVTQPSSTPPPSEPSATVPVFTTQPISQTAAAGGTVLLSAQASGTPAPAYQWRRNGLNLVDGGNVSGATSGTLTLAGVTSSDAATYTLIASNSAGSSTSDGAVVTVAAASTPPPAPPPSETPSTTPPPSTVPSTPAPAPEQPASPGVPASSPLPFPVAVAVNGSGEIFVADAGSDQLFRIAADGTLHVLAGAEGQVGSEDGAGTNARFNDPSGLTLSGDGRVIVADRANALIRLVDSAGSVTRLAGSAQYRGAADGPVASATFSSPVGVARAPSGDVYVADSMMHTIRRISLAGDVATLAGRPGTPGDADGAAGDARFNQPTGLAVDSAGVLYVADTGNNLIRRVTADGQVSTVAGIFGVSGSRDGLGGEALFNAPSGLAVDESGNLYVADTGNSTVRKITPQGIVSTFAGLPGVSGLRDGQGGDAWLSQPRSLAVDDSGNLYVADTGNARIRRISPSGAVSTLSLGDALLPPSSTTPPVVAAPSPAPSTPAPSPAPSGSGGGGGGGGGSTGALLALALAALVAGRALRASRVSNG